jgi:hypothetical protein
MFQLVAFECDGSGTIIGPANNNWQFVGGSAGPFTQLQNNGLNANGYYLVTYKLDIHTNAYASGYDNMISHTRAASVLTLDGTAVPGSVSAAQAPDNIHMYSISNTVLVQYTAGQNLSLYWWSEYFNNASSSSAVGVALPFTVRGLSLGPGYLNLSTNTITTNNQWILGLLPTAQAPNPPMEATASLVITRITGF